MVNFLKNLSRRGFMQAAGAAAAVPGRAGAASADTPEMYNLARKVPVDRGYDIVVAGGGPSGVAAAVCAARLGSKVLLVEATGCLGGMGTNGLVCQWSNTADGKRSVIGGFILELIEALYCAGQVDPNVDENWWKVRWNTGIGFNPEALKIMLDKLCHEAGVEVRFFTRVIDADVDAAKGRVNGVVLSNVEGYRFVRASAFIDGTGDAVLADLCGAQSRAAFRDTPKAMPPTVCAMISDIDYTRWRKNQEQAMVEKAIAENSLSQADRHVPGLFRTGPAMSIMNAGHLFNTNALNCRSVSDGMVLGRRLAAEYTEFYKKYMAGCEQMQVVGTASLLGVRESRRILGEYELNYADFQARRHFPDQIGIYCKSVDIHVYDLSPEEYRRYYEEFNKLDRPKPGENYGMPYGILVPKGWANLWVPGRCASSDVKVHGAIRDQPACSMLGQAAGTAAVQSIRTGQPACDLDTAQLVLTLRKAGANLPQERLSKRMTRAGV